MDIISFNEAATANSRIEKFIENPDSTSGIVTVPKVIASGETVTIPAGRVAVLPNVQIDGVLNVDGEVFIPSGSVTSQVVPRIISTDNAIVRFDGTTGAVQDSSILIDDNGNLNLSGTGKRITGDFSNAALGSRVSFQTSTANGNTSVTALPNGTSSSSAFNAFNNSSPENSSYGQLICTSTAVNLFSGASGSGTALPITFSTGGVERMRIDTISGNVLLTSGTGGLGYGAGSGGTVTQLTSKGTTVTLNKPSGQITMNNAALAAGASVSFTFTNSLIANTDILVMSLKNGSGSVNAYKFFSECANGNGVIQVTNISGISLAEAIVINFAIIKGVNS